jgi:hypothetical protein
MFHQRETFHARHSFLLSPKAATIKLMDVQEFVKKFRNVVEPKPKPLPETKTKSELAKATEMVEHKIAEIARSKENPRLLMPGSSQRLAQILLRPKWRFASPSLAWRRASRHSQLEPEDHRKDDVRNQPGML